MLRYGSGVGRGKLSRVAEPLLIAFALIAVVSVVAHATGTGSSAGFVPVSISVNPTSGTASIGDSVAITATPSGGSTPYTLTVSDNSAQILSTYITGQYTYTYSPSTTGPHTLTFQITDANDQAAKATSDITVPAAAQSTQPTATQVSALTAVPEPQSSTVQFGQTEPIVLTISGGTPPYTVTATDTNSNGGAIGSATNVQQQYTLQYGATVLGSDIIKFAVSDSGAGSTAQAITQVATVDVIPATTQPPSTQGTAPATPITTTVSPQTAAIELGQSDPITVYITGGTPPYSVSAALQDGTVLSTEPDVQSYYSFAYKPAALGYDTITFTITDKNNAQASTLSTVEVDPATTATSPATTPTGQTQAISAPVTPTMGYGTVGSPTSLTVTPSGGAGAPYTIYVYNNGVYQTKATTNGAYTYTYTPTQAGTQNIAFVVYDGTSSTHYTQTATVNVQQQTQQSQPAVQQGNDEVQSSCTSSSNGDCQTCKVYNKTNQKYMGTCTSCTSSSTSHMQSWYCDIFQPYDSQRSTTTTSGTKPVYTTRTTYFPDEYNTVNVTYLPYTSSGGTQVSGGVSNEICVSYGLIESTTTWPSIGRNPGGSSLGLGGGSGYCGSSNNNEFATTYSGSDAGGSQITLQQSQAQPSPTPQIMTVLDQNAQNAQWLITCPTAPNPKSTVEYFSSMPTSFIGGNRCITDTSPLSSNVILSVSTNWGLTQPASSQADIRGQNFAQGAIKDIAYSGQTSDQGSQQSQISNGYNTESYIFQQVPASQQHGIWTWQAKYANLANTNLNVLQQSEAVNADVGGVYYVCTGYSTCNPTPIYCIWPYTYKESSAITSIQNTQIPIPTKISSATTDYFSVDGNTYTLNPSTQLNGACIDAMYGGLQGGGLFLFCGSGWSQVSNSGDIYYNGNLYQNLHVYANQQQYPGTYFAAYGVGLAGSGSGTQSGSSTYGYVSVLPYILYNISLPATYSNLNGNEQFLNLSLDTYSPHNFLNPASYLDQFPLYTDAGFFANYAPNGQGGVLTEFPSSLVSLTAPAADSIMQGVGTLLSTLNNYQACLIGFGGSFKSSQCSGSKQQIKTSFTPLGRYIAGTIVHPIYVAAAPNDYIYAVNYTSQCNWWTLCTTTTTNSYLFVMRYIPTGDYNVSNDQPNSVGPATSEQTTTTPVVCNYGYCGTGTPSTTQSGTADPASAWAANWQSYWSNTTAEQSKNLYITNIYALADPTLAYLPFWGQHVLGQSQGLGSILPLAVGTDYGNDVFVLGQQITGGQGFGIGAIVKDPADGSTVSIANTSVTKPEVTYTTGPNAGKKGNFIPSLPGEFAVSPGGQFMYVGNSTIGEIETYEVSQVTTGVRAPPYFVYSGSISLSYSNSSFNMDIGAYLKNGGPFQNASMVAAQYKNAPASYDSEANHHPVAISDSQGILYVLDNWTFTVDNRQSSVLMLRAFSENGIEIPINPAQSDTLTPVNPQGVSTSVSITANPPVGWPAYGFPISAYIAMPDGSVQTYCAVGCTVSPKSQWLQGFGYYPVGPEIGHNGAAGQGSQDIGMSTDFNGTSYLMAHVSQGGNTYAELLAFHPTLANYTKISLGADAQYLCYTDMQGTPAGAASSPCTSLQGSQATTLESIYPPLLGVPSSFSYVESQGSPVQYLSGPGTLSSLFPTGLDSKAYQSQASSIASGGFPGQQPSYSQQGLQSGSYTTTPTGSVGAPSAIPVVYANSVINGYAVVPYEVKYTVSQDWAPNPVDLGGFCGKWFFPNTQQQSFDSYTYSVAPFTGSNFLNNTIEGGGIYAKYLPRNNYYIANISDAGAQLLPYININLFTSRVLGELYVNQTISPQTAYNGKGGNQYPLVLNATRQYDYQVNTYTQSFGASQYPAYATQEAVPTQVNGADCGSTCPDNYYYSPNPVYYMPTNNLISYTNTISSQPLQLFSVFKFTTYIDNLLLNMTNDTKILGYNRFVYTFADRFGNTYYMPLDADIANKTQISLTITPTVSPTNPNETSVAIDGVAQSVTPLKTAPLPKGSTIYIYYDQNINYYNASTSQGVDSASYYQWAEQCAFAPNTKACETADPLATITQAGGIAEASYPTFHTDYSSKQQCAPEPTSLLQTPDLAECNIYGRSGLPSTKFNPGTNSYEYCVPNFLNGTGTFTPQLGLVTSVKTDASGGFSATFNVCGTGAHRIMAQYYGDPPPEPNYVSQTTLSQSGGSYEFQPSSGSLPLVKTLEYGYTYAPNMTTAGVNIGNYALSIGPVNAIEAAAFVAVVVAILIASSGAKRKKRRSKSTRRRRR